MCPVCNYDLDQYGDCEECGYVKNSHGKKRDIYDPYFRNIYFNQLDFNMLDHKNIQCYRQNVPELIVQDCITEFGLDEQQAEKLRMILLVRGVNKWFYARRQFIKLKHEIKEMLKSRNYPYYDKNVHKTIEKIYVKMQSIAKLPRWIWWPKTVTHKWANIERKIITIGRRD